MKYIFLLLFPVFFYSCQSNSNATSKAEHSSSGSAGVEAPAVKKDTYFVLLKGTVGTYPVTMYLYAQKKKYSGYYYYDSKEQLIYLGGDDTTNNGKITLNAYHQDSAETFVLNFEGNGANGSWAYNGKTLPVRLLEANMPVKFSYQYWQDSIKLVDTLDLSPQATAQISSVWPTGSSAADEFIKTQITELLLPKRKMKDIDSVFHQSGKTFFDDYKSDNELTEEDMKELGESSQRYTYELEDDVYVCFQNNKMLVLASTNYSYTGGAHGNYGTSYIPLNLVNNTVITLSQILTPEGIQQLRPLLENSYRRSNHLTASQPLTEGGLLENKIEPNKNFYATSKQLLFSYTPYEIGPYAAGQIDIAVDIKDLHNYLQPSFKSLLQ